MYIPQRFHVVLPWLRASLHGDANVPLRELIAFLRQPPRNTRARRWIQNMVEEGDFLKITFGDFPQPLFWPRSEDAWSLWMLINEQFDEHDWHHYEIPETTVQADDVVVDCGACEGLFSLRVAPRCRRVFAVEPHPLFVAAMRRTLAPFANAEIVPLALGERTGDAFLTLDGERTRFGATGGYRVAIETLDGLFLDNDPPVSYLKADVEGFELSLLRGAAELLRRQRPKVAVTVYHEANDYREMMAFLRSVQPAYRFRVKGITATGKPVMLHAW